MITVRRSHERHYVHDAQHASSSTFQTGPPLGWGAFAQLSETRLAAGASLPLKTASAFELVSYLREGSLAFRASAGASSQLHAGEFQHVIGGPGSHRRAYNPSSSGSAQIFRLWFHAARASPQLGAQEQHKRFSAAERRGHLCLVAAPEAARGALRMHADAFIYSALLECGQHLVHALEPQRRSWLHVVSGVAQLDELSLYTGDAVGVVAELALSFTARSNLEILLIDSAQS